MFVCFEWCLGIQWNSSIIIRGRIDIPNERVKYKTYHHLLLFKRRTLVNMPNRQSFHYWPRALPFTIFPLFISFFSFSSKWRKQTNFPPASKSWNVNSTSHSDGTGFDDADVARTNERINELGTGFDYGDVTRTNERINALVQANERSNTATQIHRHIYTVNKNIGGSGGTFEYHKEWWMDRLLNW